MYCKVQAYKYPAKCKEVPNQAFVPPSHTDRDAEHRRQ